MPPASEQSFPKSLCLLNVKVCSIMQHYAALCTIMHKHLKIKMGETKRSNRPAEARKLQTLLYLSSCKNLMDFHFKESRTSGIHSRTGYVNMNHKHN